MIKFCVDPSLCSESISLRKAGHLKANQPNAPEGVLCQYLIKSIDYGSQCE